MIALLLVAQLAAGLPADALQTAPPQRPGLVENRPVGRRQTCAGTAKLQQADPVATGRIEPEGRERYFLKPLGKLPPASMCLLDDAKAQVQP